MQKLVLLFVLVAASLTQPKTFTRCGLAQELKTQGFPADNLADWVCLVENESRRRTDRVGKLYEDGSRDYGLFSINDLYWCSKNNTPGNDCNATCSQMTTDDITKASMCAKAVFNLHGFDEWYGWRNHCKGKRLPDISKCFMNNKRKKQTERPRSIHSRATTPVSRPHTTAPTPHVPRYTTVPLTRAPYFWVPPLW